MRFIGLDVHRDFCEVAIAMGGGVRLAGRVQTERLRAVVKSSRLVPKSRKT
jgi:hypothetical protein